MSVYQSAAFTLAHKSSLAITSADQKLHGDLIISQCSRHRKHASEGVCETSEISLRY